MSLGPLLEEARVALENTYLDPASRYWITRFIVALEEEEWTEQPQPTSEPGLVTTDGKSDDEDISLSTSSTPTTQPTEDDPSPTLTPPVE